MSIPGRKNSLGLPPSGSSTRADNFGSFPIGNSTRKDSFGSFPSLRKDSLSWASDDFLGTLSHTPPTFTPGSLEIPMMKRTRTGSISGRLRSASDLEERGLIDRYQKGILKDLIITGDASLQDALDQYENGDPSALEALMENGMLDRKCSLDLFEDLDLSFLNVGSLGNTPNNEYNPEDNNLDGFGEELRLDSSFASIRGPSQDEQLESSLPSSLPLMGIGISPPNLFSFPDDFLDSKGMQLHDSASSGNNSPSISPKREKENLSSNVAIPKATMSVSRPIGIPGSSSNARPIPRPTSGVDPLDSTSKQLVGAYSPDSRRKRIEKFLDKRQKRVWTKKVKYDVRKNFADSRLRVKGRFVKKEDEQLLRELLSLT